MHLRLPALVDLRFEGCSVFHQTREMIRTVRESLCVSLGHDVGYLSYTALLGHLSGPGGGLIPHVVLL